MKKFIKKILLLSLILAILYPIFIIIIGEIFGPNQKNLKFIPERSWTKRKLSEASSYGNIDILFIGSSHAYRGYDIRFFNKFGRSFNLGTTSQTPLQSYFLLKKFISILNPKYIIIDIYFPLFESDGVESSIDIVSNHISKDNIKLFIMSPNPIVLNTLIYSYYYNYAKNTTKLKNYSNKFDTYISGGFVEREIQFFANKERFFEKNIKINQIQKKSFEKLIAFIKKKKIKYVIIHSPITKAEYSSYLNTKELNDYFESKGFYLNFNEIQIPLYDNIHFYDKHHLNQYGVYIFNKYLAEFLIEMFPELKNKK
ncbi:MAG: hypothetical protein ACK4YF_09320 [Exilispira sp.]